MNLYVIATQTIREFAKNEQAKLNQKRHEVRQAHVDYLMKAGYEGCSNEQKPLVDVFTNTFRIGRDGDDYPIVTISEEFKNLMKAALKAGIVNDYGYISLGKLNFYADLSGLVDNYRNAHHDRIAWMNATEYERNQTWQKL